MKSKFILILFAVFFMTSEFVSAQEIKTTNFNELEPIFHYQNDTTYVINFWAMWCKPCVEELPHFETIRKKYSDKKVKVILVSLDFGKNVQERLAKFKIKRNVNSHIVILDDPDADIWISKVSEKWDGALPATVIYNKNKRDVFTRQVSYNDLVESINKISNQTN